MGQHSEKKERAVEKNAAKTGSNGTILVVRLVIASVIIIAALLFDIAPIVEKILLAVALAVGGYDIAMDAIDRVEAGEYFGLPVLVTFAAVLAFVIGHCLESAVAVLIYRGGFVALSYADNRTRESAKELLKYRDEQDLAKVLETTSRKGALRAAVGDEIYKASSFILRLTVIFALVFAVAVPVFTNIPYSESIYRALMIIVIASPMSVVTAIPLVCLVGLFDSAQFGVHFGNAKKLEAFSENGTVIIDKAGIFAAECPKVVSIQSDILDTDTFLNFASHAVYYSDQPVAKAIGAYVNTDYKLDLISNFVDIPGCGVDVEIGGAHVTLATRELFVSRGEAVPYEGTQNNSQIYYMMISDRYVGKIAISNSINPASEYLVSEIKARLNQTCVMFSEDSKEDTEIFASKLGFDNFFGELDTEKKLRIIDDIKKDSGEQVIYVYSKGIEAHSSADIDMRVGKKSKFADALVYPECVANLPAVINVSKRMKEVIAENAIIAFVIKAILIFLSINGWSGIWFALFIDFAAAIGTQLNSIRVTKESLINEFLEKRNSVEE